MNNVIYFSVAFIGISIYSFVLYYFDIPVKGGDAKVYALSALPIYFGLMSIFMMFIYRRSRNTTNKRYLSYGEAPLFGRYTAIITTVLISSLTIFLVVYVSKSYPLQGIEWLWYYILLIILHSIAYSTIFLVNTSLVKKKV